MKSVKVGVIGVGFMGTYHAKTYAALADAELAGVADIDISRADSLASELGVRSYHDARQLLDDPSVDAVSICTNDDRHVELTVSAIGAGKHIMLEKPIATTLSDADRILSAAKGFSKCFLVGHILRFEKRYAEAKRSVDEGRIGEVVSIFARRLNAVAAQKVLGGACIGSFISRCT